MRLAAYGTVSTLLATCAVLAAFRQRANFYAASVYLSKSNACMMILCNFGIFCTVILSKILQSIFFGKLRSIELERLHDRLWFTVTETLLALAMFRDEFDTTFVVLFISLIFVKCFHWLASDRVEWMDQSATPPGRLFHARMISVLSLIWITDLLLIAYATESVLLHGPSVVLMFEMEYIIMQVTCLSIICKYLLNSYGQYRAQEHWEAKSTYLFYIDLATDFLKLLTYIGFLSLTVTFYGLPINVLRDVYYTARSFISKCNNLMRFRQATRNMNERYPNATREEMDVLADKTCIICREDMEFRDDAPRRPVGQENPDGGASAGPNDTPKKLPCGHIFHFHCLRSWLERQQTCPTCRRPVLQTPAPHGTRTAVAAAAAAPGAAAPGVPPVAGGQQPAAGDAALLGQQQNMFGQLLAPNPNGYLNAQIRNDYIQQRLREIQQRIANNANAVAGAPGSSAGSVAGQSNAATRGSTGGQSVAGQGPSNPLMAFEIPSQPGAAAGRAGKPATDGQPAPNAGSSTPGPLLHSLGSPAQALAAGVHPNGLPLAEYAKQSAELDEPIGRSDELANQASLAPSSALTGLGGANPQATRPAPEPPTAPGTEGAPKTPRLWPMMAAATTAGPARGVASTGLDRAEGVKGPRLQLPTLADTNMPCLIPLFDTETYTVPASLRRAVEGSRSGRRPIVVDKSTVVLPRNSFKIAGGQEGEEEGEEGVEEVVRKSLENKLVVLMSVQQRLRECSIELQRCLGVSLTGADGGGGYQQVGVGGIDGQEGLDGDGSGGVGNGKGKGKALTGAEMM